ncbi:MAG: molecular chaperone [bacterium]
MNESDFALCRSGFYEALALGFAPPNQETFDRMLTEQQNQALAEIAAVLDERSSRRIAKSLSLRVRELLQCADVQTTEALACSYRFLFGHIAHARVPPYETEYGEETVFQQPHQLGDIAGFCRAFGLVLNSHGHERVDHISCECEFLAFLTRKEAFAREHNDTVMLQETRKAQKLFLRDHLARFTPSFANLLVKEDPEGFYGALGSLSYEFILLECSRFGVTAAPEQLRLRPTSVMDACLTCGSGEEIIRDLTAANSELK